VSHVDIVKGDEDAEDDSAGRDIPAQGYDDDTRGVIRLRTFMRFWRSEIEPLDQFGRFFNLVAQREVITVGPHKRTRAIVSADFMPYLEELLAFHPGLAFLESTPEFQEKYARTVVARIMFELDTQGTAAITERALRRSDLLHAFHTVDMEEDINAVTRFFSYEHFYVLYCKFWELDSDHDFFLSRDNLNALPDLTHVLLDRVFAGAGRVSTGGTPGKMGYEDFVCFFLAEEDKTSETAIRYWFKVCDVDGDRVITPPDVAYFYKHQLARMQELGNEPVKLDDIITQMSDLLKPDVPGHFELKDFLEPTRSKLTGVFFSTLFNLSKFQQFEAKDAVVVKQELNTSGITQWDRYASVEYMRLAEEEEEDEAAGAAVLTGAGSGMGGAMEMADNSRAGWSG
jgi:serine/threonine-protein phosphatase 2A regulatory subunit B''